MKKHPVDDLFAKKMAEHRQEPSQKAFEKFQTRLGERQQKRRGGFFLSNRNWGYYAAAAGIVAALTVGILSQKNTANETVLANKNEPKQVENSTQSVLKDATVRRSDSQLVVAQKDPKNLDENGFVQQQKVSQGKAVTLPTISNEISVAQLETKHRVAENIIDDSPVEQTSVAINTIFETTNEKLESKEVKATESFKNPLDESIVLVLEPEQQEELIPEINPDSPILLAETKRLGEEKEENAKSFIVKLYGEYKHFKYGEKVDLKKIGVKDVLARVDESLFKEERDDMVGFVQRKVGRLQKRD